MIGTLIGRIVHVYDHTTLLVMLVIFLATLIRSAFGFGEALVAVPLLALWVPLEIAAPLAVLVSITVAAVVVIQDWKSIHVQSTAWLVGATVLGIPLGVVLLTNPHQQFVRAALGCFIAAFAAYFLIVKNPPELKHDSRIWLAISGFLAGILGGAYGMNGPPLIIYGSLRRWSSQHFRATLQGYFLPASIIGMIGYAAAGLWVHAVTHYYLASIPIVFPAIFLGRAINHRVKGEVFLKLVYAGLMGIGFLLMYQSARR